MSMNILVFGPNGSGKGTQGAIVQKKYDIPHIESGAIFRQNIKGGTELGKKAKAFVEEMLTKSKMSVIIRTIKSDKYDRYLADVWIANQYLNQALLDEGLAVRVNE